MPANFWNIARIRKAVQCHFWLNHQCHHHPHYFHPLPITIMNIIIMIMTMTLRVSSKGNGKGQVRGACHNLYLSLLCLTMHRWHFHYHYFHPNHHQDHHEHHHDHQRAAHDGAGQVSCQNLCILLSHQGAAKSHEKLLSIDSTKYLFRDKIGYECEINFKLEQPLGKFCDQNLTKKRVLRHLSLIPCTSSDDVICEQPLIYNRENKS